MANTWQGLVKCWWFFCSFMSVYSLCLVMWVIYPANAVFPKYLFKLNFTFILVFILNICSNNKMIKLQILCDYGWYDVAIYLGWFYEDLRAWRLVFVWPYYWRIIWLKKVFKVTVIDVSLGVALETSFLMLGRFPSRVFLLLGCSQVNPSKSIKWVCKNHAPLGWVLSQKSKK